MSNGTRAQSRKWCIEINNPIEYGFNHEVIKELLNKFFPKYYCFADEIATTGTYHTHIFIYSESPIRFETIKNRFKIAHIEKGYGNCYENRAYVLKEGKWKNTEKAETSVPNTFYEYGECPMPQEENDPKKIEIITLIKEGKNNEEILNSFPELIFKLKDIDYLRNSILECQYSKDFRKVESTYIYGNIANSNKIKYIFSKHKNEKICLVADFDHTMKFDSYHNQEILVIEFQSNKFPINTILNLMKGVPIQLPARYNNRQPKYKYLYLVATSDLKEQYVSSRGDNPILWNEFVNGFDKVIEFKNDGTIVNSTTGEVIDWKEK